MSLDFRTIDPPAARFNVLDLDRCYWWTDESGQVWIAMERQIEPLLLGPLARFVFQVSLNLEKPPAGKARNYTLDARTLRAVLQQGPLQGRFVSVSGIAALYRAPNDRLRGSLRLTATQQVNRMLGGWGQPSRYLFLGNFEAVHDEQRGRAIAAATESAGWEREPRPETQPAKTALTGDAEPPSSGRVSP